MAESNHKLSAILLAAGLSTRMGKENKLLLPFHKKTILETTLTNLLESKIDNVIVVIGHDQSSITTILKNYPVKVVVNENYQTGLVSSIKKGVLSVEATDNFMVSLADMPMITSVDYNNFMSCYKGQLKKCIKIVRPISKNNTPGNPVIFHNSMKDELLANPNKESNKSVIIKHKDAIAFFQTERPCFFSDIDTVEDYGRLSTSG